MSQLSLPASIAVLLVMCSSASALECPVPTTIDDPTSAALMEKYLPADTALDAPDALQSAVFDLKRAGLSDELILDNLIAVYCPSVDAIPGLSDEDKTQRVQAFAEMASGLVFNGGN